MTINPYYPFDIEQWFALPLELRKRWFQETNNGASAPTAKLWGAINAALSERWVSK